MPEAVKGLLKHLPRGAFVLFDPAHPSAEPIGVSQKLIEQYKLVEGVAIAGATQTGQHGLELVDVQKVCDVKPAVYQKRKPFADLVPIDPHERFNLSVEGDTSMRIVDLIAPIAKGTRGLIIAPPKAGMFRKMTRAHSATAMVAIRK